MAQLKVAVLLSGCGFLDGSEIHESVATLWALDKRGVEAICVAPSKPQADVVDHATGKAQGGSRDVAVESARIARGAVRPAKGLHASDADALILPGGYGAAKNLSTFATEGPACQVDPEVARLVREFHGAKKPIGAICIAPAVVAKVLGADHGPELTIGNDAATAKALESLGVRHVAKAVREVHVDEKNRIVTTPAYMLARGPAEVFEGVDRLVDEVVKRTKR